MLILVPRPACKLFCILISLISNQVHVLCMILCNVILVKCKLYRYPLIDFLHLYIRKCIGCVNHVAVKHYVPKIAHFLHTGGNLAPSQTEPKSTNIVPTTTTLSSNHKSENLSECDY